MAFKQTSHAEQEAYNKQREEMFKQFDEEKKQKKRKTMLAVYSAVGIMFLVIAGSFVFYYFKPSYYDDFAKCLTEKGAVMYGAIKWCKYTQAQAAMFGKSFKYINYHDEKELQGIKTRPTWVINGKWYETVQSFEALSEATGCKVM
ncbi:hypothetical protein J4231_02470 [Candidatus Woesearchaeota archaeon]|nr:hypothetical protein [Candidatus Woesearchaeota archaeon]